CNVRRESLAAASVSLERLLDYIERNLRLELSGEALAGQACMSLRSLYGLFDRHLGVTPGQYIRQRRLERVHACLGDASCPVRSLTELALDHGFLHLGRFSESYRQRFGELPSETLKRRG
ncbi:MAG TPA: helix-turn-helix transcriptional regulator, partial [Pseudomonas sp.]|uniref:helix-turn-helix transcriptional regulator n=1 Tax=Pseudomonas sp. TaxID=306 RepID=UPI002B46F041